ncbi:MAG: hypothetical protein IJ733_12945 [Lachnospiraceae bacterium]|nr:hypothetical protein [Lachnospiraceae bacterium]
MKLSTNTLDVWETRAADDGAYNENYMKFRNTLSADSNGNYIITVKPWSVVTVTSLDKKNDAASADVLFENTTLQSPYASIGIRQMGGQHKLMLSAGYTFEVGITGAWQHECGQGMYVWQRTRSVATEKGASLSYTFTGTGLEILGANQADIPLDVTIDGEKLSGDQKTIEASDLCTAYSITNLEYGTHTITISMSEIIQDSKGKDCYLSIDGIGILGAGAEKGDAIT